jgi:hypothetical protein
VAAVSATRMVSTFIFVSPVKRLGLAPRPSQFSPGRQQASLAQANAACRCWPLSRTHGSFSISTRGPFGEGRYAVGTYLLPVSAPAFSARRKRRTVVRRCFVLLRDDRLDIHCPQDSLCPRFTVPGFTVPRRPPRLAAFIRSLLNCPADPSWQSTRSRWPASGAGPTPASRSRRLQARCPTKWCRSERSKS